MKLVYLAGPYRARTAALVATNVEKARETAAALWRRGYAVLSPHLNTHPVEEAATAAGVLARAIRLMQGCGAEVLPPGGQES